MWEMLVASPVTRAAGLALVHFVWQGALIAGAAAWLFRSLRHARATSRYLVGCVALLTMATAPIVTTFRALDEPATASIVTADTATADRATGVTAAIGSPAVILDAGFTVAAGAPRTNSFARTLPIVVLAWMLGVFALTVNLATAWLRARHLRHSAFPVGEPWAIQMDILMQRLGFIRRVVLSESAAVDVPTLVGWIRPAILVPGSVLTGLTPSQLDAILTHELAHVRRHDYVINVLQSAIETLLFYHPAVWWLSRRVRIERELCCDDVVVAVCGDRVVYARALASLEELRSRQPMLGMAATDGPLLQRIRRILTPAPVDESRSSAWSILTTVVAVAPLVLFGGVVESSPAAEPVRIPALQDTSTISPRTLVTATAPAVSNALPTVRRTGVVAPPADTASASPDASLQVQPPAGTTADQKAVLALEERFRLAKVEGNVQALDPLLDEAFLETNQNGNTRSKAQTLELWRTFRIDLLTIDAADVRLVGDLATVTGRQTEINPTGTDVMLFTRVWRRVNGTWTLYSVTQFRDPNPAVRRVTAVGSSVPPRMVRLQYELFRNSSLLGRPTVNTISGRPWTIQIPGEMPVSAIASVIGESDIQVAVTPGTSSSPVPVVKLQGGEPASASWTAGSNTYLLRLRNLTDSATRGSGRPPVSVGGNVRRPEIVHKVDPVYPPDARAARVGGMVIVEMVLDESGSVSEAKIVRSVPMLDAAALEAVRQWRYTPTILNGEPVPVRMSVNVTFATQ